MPAIKIYFSDFFDVSQDTLDAYGAFNISLVNDMPLFVDPFLLFNSDNEVYQKLHSDIISYVKFLKEISKNHLDDGLVNSLFAFKEVKQNYFGYSKVGNEGRGLGVKFAKALSNNLTRVFKNFGDETISKGSHLEKLTLVDSGVGRDSISDFVTNLIKDFLAGYTQEFSIKHIDGKFLKQTNVPKSVFNYETCTWEGRKYTLPVYNGSFVLLTPKDILTKDDTWINKPDILIRLDDIISSIPNESLRAHINFYFNSRLPKDEVPSKKQEQEALIDTLANTPELLDYYIKYKEENGKEAHTVSRERVAQSEQIFITSTQDLVRLLKSTEFYSSESDSVQATRARLKFLKHVIEKEDGYRFFYVKSAPIQREEDLQLIFKLTWYATIYDVNSEVNNGRGPVDFKISSGRGDKTLVEFKLASNTKLKQNLEKQVKIYEEANSTSNSFKAILFFTEAQEEKVKKILKDLNLQGDENIFLIDARNDNKPSASTA